MILDSYALHLLYKIRVSPELNDLHCFTEFYALCCRIKQLEIGTEFDYRLFAQSLIRCEAEIFFWFWSYCDGEITAHSGVGSWRKKEVGSFR